jgi:hypothetical protein
LWGENVAIADFNLITDRTQLDVDRRAELKAKGWQAMTAEEKAEWQTSLKGGYNYTDMNRVESAVEYVANKLTLAGYVVIPVIKKNWIATDKPTTDDIKRYMKNVADIREALATFSTTPEAPTIEQRLTYQMANDIEQILLDVDDLITKMVNAYFFSGDLYSGEV